MSKVISKNKILDLVENYDTLVRDGKLGDFSEADVGSKFILPFVEAFGWDIKNIDEVREQKRTLVGPVDYSLNVNKNPKIVVEIKKFTQNLDDKRTVRGKTESYPEQAIQYAWHLKVDWVILSNFAETRLYYSHVREPENGLIFKFKHNEYLANLDKLWIISKESVVSGILDIYEKRRERVDIDQEVLVDLFDSRQMLIQSIYKNNPDLSKEDIGEIVQKILDRILVIRVAEDRGIIGSDSLWKELDAWKTRGLPTPFMRSLKTMFRDFDEIYNSKLFEKHKCEDIILDNDKIEKVINLLYKYNFDLISSDVLGAIYEDYIGHILKEAEKGIDLIKERDIRKKSGIYYTPTHVVEYIIRKTIGEILNGKSLDEISKIKILDPACGSGSFLIKAFDILKEHYEGYNKNEKEKENAVGLIKYTNLIPDIEKRIINDNIFGVDLDPQAAEIASVNIMLKALRKGERLPLILGDNIKCGNSLISTKDDELQKYFGEGFKKERPFEWTEEFQTIFKDGGFDVVVGNPPHGAKLTPEERKFFEQNYDVGKGYKNSASLFIERSLNLLKPGGLMGLVIPKSLTFSQRWGKVRNFILNNFEILEIADISKAFLGVLLEQIILLCKKKPMTSKSYKGTKLFWGEEIQTYDIPIELCKKLDNFPIHVDPNSFSIFKKIKKGSIPLKKISQTFRGLPVQSKVSTKHIDNSEPLLRGDDIKPYYHTTPQTFIKKSELREDSEKIKEMRQSKIISQRIIAHVLYPTDHIIIMSTFDSEGILSVDTVENTIITDPKYDPKYVLAFLNSKITSWYAYNFIFNKAIRTMDFDDYYVSKIPIYPAEPLDQKKLINSVDELISLTKELIETKINFVDYVNKYPRLDDTEFQTYYNRVLAEDKKVNIPSYRKGRIKNLKIEHEDDWLIFKINGIMEVNGNEQEIEGLEILRIKLEDNDLLKFLAYSLSSAKVPSNKGNILNKILKIKIPYFDKRNEKNLFTIKDIMRELMPAINKHKQVITKIIEHENEINHVIYDFYKLSETEIDFIEKNSRPGSIIVNLLT